MPFGAYKSTSTKTLSFDENAKEPTDGEFLDEYAKYTLSTWYVTIFILACIPPFCVESIRVATTMSLDVEITCLIPNLINKMAWNIYAVRNLTMPDAGRACTYIAYNYSMFDNMDPEEAFEAKEQYDEELEAAGKVIPIQKCTVPVTWVDYPFYNETSNFLYSCHGSNFKQKAKHFRRIFQGIGYIILGTLADLFGRKRILLISLFISAVGCILTPLASSFHKLIVAYTIEAFGFAGLLITNYILFLELCHRNNRALLMLYMDVSGALAKLCGYILKSYVYDLPKMYMFFLLPSVSLLYYAYYMPESPRWQLSYGKKKKAWQLLKLWGHKATPSHFLPEPQTSRVRLLVENLEVIFGVPKYRRTILIMSFLASLKVIIIGNVNRYVKLGDLSALSHKFLVFMTEICSYFCILPPFFLFGKFLALFYMIISGAVCLLGSIFIRRGPRWYVLNLLSAQYFYGLNLIASLYAAELLPTAMRGMGMGFIIGSGTLLDVLARVVTTLSASPGIVKETENVAYFVLQIIGIALMTVLPNLRVGELPDWKRYRNSMNT